MIRNIISSDLFSFVQYCQKVDEFNDFYIEKDSSRIVLNNFANAESVFNSCLKHGSKAFICEKDGLIRGLFIVFGQSPNRTLKILVDSKKIANDMFKFYHWNLKIEATVTFKKHNPLLNLCQYLIYRDDINKKKYFSFVGEKNGEVTLKYNPDGTKRPVFFKKETDE